LKAIVRTKIAGAGADAADAEASALLRAHAEIAARAELGGERSGILGATERRPLPALLRPRRVPERWSFLHLLSHFS
jgi:hypothetical protein